MAFSDFTLEQVGRILGIQTAEADLFAEAPQVVPPAWLIEILKKRTQLSLISEKARSEFIVVPILIASRDLSPFPLAIFSGQRLDVDPSLGLVGECDFILASTAPIPPLRAPIATIVEAKKNDIESGLGQCVAQMVAARLFNKLADRADSPIFGCVTTGEVWQFLLLEHSHAAIDRRRFYLDDPGGILSAIQQIIVRTADPSAQKSN